MSVFAVIKTYKPEYNEEHECETTSVEAVRSTKELAEVYIKEQMGSHDFFAKKMGLENDTFGRQRELDSYTIEEVSDFK